SRRRPDSDVPRAGNLRPFAVQTRVHQCCVRQLAGTGALPARWIRESGGLCFLWGLLINTTSLRLPLTLFHETAAPLPRAAAARALPGSLPTVDRPPG